MNDSLSRFGDVDRRVATLLAARPRNHRDQDYRNLSTIHSAKGQEWSSVFVLNAVDGCGPNEMTLR
jgi:superfamily I DNA/RNA helicase